MAGGIHPPLSVIAQWPKPNYDNPQTRGWGLVALCVILGLISVVVVSLRLFSRLKLTRNAGIDDWVLLFAMVPAIMLAVSIGLASKRYYFDRHVWDVPIPNGLVEIRQIAFVIELLYIWAVAFIKLSILLFYKRLTADILTDRFRWMLWATMASVVAYLIIFNFTLFFTCDPLSAFWDQVNPFWKATHTYTCHDEKVLLLTASVVSVIQDLIVAGVPTIFFFRLKIPIRQRVALAGVFAVGLFLCIAGCMRIVYIDYIFNKSYDPTWVASHAWSWTAVEVLLGTVVASAPALNVLFKGLLGSSEVYETFSEDYTRSSSRLSRMLSRIESRRSSQPIQDYRARNSAYAPSEASEASEAGHEKRLSYSLTRVQLDENPRGHDANTLDTLKGNESEVGGSSDSGEGYASRQTAALPPPDAAVSTDGRR